MARSWDVSDPDHPEVPAYGKNGNSTSSITPPAQIRFCKDL